MLLQECGGRGPPHLEPQPRRGQKGIVSPNKFRGPLSEGGTGAEPSKASSVPYRSQLIFLLSFFSLFLATPRGLWDLSSPTRDQTQEPCSGSTES